MVAREGFVTPTTPQGASPAFVTAKNRYKGAIDYGSTFVQQIVSSSTPLPLAAIGNVA